MFRKLRLVAAVAATIVLIAPPASYSNPPGRAAAHAPSVTESANGVYIAIMDLAPAATYEGGLGDFAATKPGKGQRINPNSAHFKKYVGLLRNKQQQVLAQAGVPESAQLHSYTVSLNGVAAKMTLEQAQALAGKPGVAAVLPDQWRWATTDNSPDFLGLTDPVGGPYVKGFDGEGVVVGIIDSGIWPEHPSLVDDGSYGPAPIDPVPCEFGNTTHNSDDAPFACNNKLVGARQMLATYRAVIGAEPEEFDSARDDDGHGTHTATTAAGNAGVSAAIFGIPRGSVSGIAPRAHVIAYKGLGSLGGFTSDLAAAIDQAVADGVDVINYSVGGGAGAPGADELAFLFAADAGVFVATSAGNSGPGAQTLGNPGTMPWLTTVGASTQDRTFQGSVSSSDGWEYFGASLTEGTTAELPLVDAAAAGSELCIPGALNPAVVAGKIVLCKRGVNARAAKSRAVFEAGGAGTILYNENDSQATNTDNHWTPTVHINNTDGLAIKTYIGSTGSAAVAQITGGEFTTIDAPDMASFSSRGANPVSPDIIKPDITAPGVNILAGHSPTHTGDDPQGELFQAISGTSMSSPHIAGLFALLKQAHPEWSPAMARSALMTTAHQDVSKEDGATPADPFDLGAGHVDAGGEWSKGSVNEPGLAYDAGINDYLGYLCDDFPAVFANPAATCATLANAGFATEAHNLNLPSIGIAEVPGTATVRRTVTSVAKENGNRTYNVSVDAPPGYTVSVSPASFRLKRGQSATYEVTVTNVSAPVGAWRFGSLTWHEKNGEYSVYSPIAVKGKAFQAPSAVTGNGETGSASFDVSFGYTGAYSAAAHGLEPATVTSDNVPQDPDQTFDRNDGYSNVHQFNLAGAAYFRIALPPDATEAGADLDIFVYNPSGGLVASSTEAGTDELVEITAPADGTWSVYVHGWSAPGGDSDYDLYTWVVSATPGGNLVIDSAPASATSGNVEAIDISWSGATAGQWHFGAVAHTGPSGLLGLTLVEVDNR